MTVERPAWDHYSAQAADFSKRYESVEFEEVHEAWRHLLPSRVGLALAFKLLRVESAYLAAAVESKSSRTIVSNPEIDRAIDDVGRDGAEIARRRMADAVRREPDNVDAALALWSVSLETGREADAAETLRSAFESSARSASGATLLRLAVSAQDLDPALSATAARAVLEHPDSSARVKLAAEDLLSRAGRTQVTVSS